MRESWRECVHARKSERVVRRELAIAVCPSVRFLRTRFAYDCTRVPLLNPLTLLLEVPVDFSNMGPHSIVDHYEKCFRRKWQFMHVMCVSGRVQPCRKADFLMHRQWLLAIFFPLEMLVCFWRQ
jgi:hypothetical protein